MYKIYKIHEGTLQTFSRSTRTLADVWVDLKNPTEQEIRALKPLVDIPEEILTDVKDINEVPKLDKIDDFLFLLMQTPVMHPSTDPAIPPDYTVAPLGILLNERCVVTITWTKNDVISYLEEKLHNIRNNRIVETSQRAQFVLKLMLFTAKIYLRYLKDIHHRLRIPHTTTHKLDFDKDTIALLKIERSLVYFNASLRSNFIVVEKIAKRKQFTTTEDDQELLGDVIDENRQGVEVVKVYGHIVEDIRGTISSLISNDLARRVNWLTKLTIILSIPVMVASFYGMNVFLPFADFHNTFWILAVFSLFLMVLASLWLNKSDN